jgi:hypothetical protein
MNVLEVLTLILGGYMKRTLSGGIKFISTSISEERG